MRCPACGCELVTVETTAGQVQRCRRGHGTSINVAVLRRRFDETLALWRAASRQPQGSRPCPACARSMRAFFWQGAREGVELDACSTCQLVWFDAAEVEALRIRLSERRSVASAGATPGRRLGVEVNARHRTDESFLTRAAKSVDLLDLLRLLEFFDF